MKYSLFLFISLLFIWGCEESFSPKTDFSEDYVLYGIINGDTTYQSFFLSRTYDVPGYDPFSNSEDPFFTDAVIKIFYEGEVIEMRDTSVERNEDDRYSPPFSFYYTDAFKPDPGKEIRVVAELGNGHILEGSTTTPRSNYVQFLVGSDRLVPEEDGFIDIEWKLPDSNELTQIYLPQLKIRYYKFDEGPDQIYEIEVPVNYIVSEGGYVPNYPTPTALTTLRYEMAAFDRTMSLISEGDSNKYNYTIMDASFELLLMDDNLIPYYYSTETFLDGYTIILDELEYSNIEGGLGLIGSFFQEKSYRVNISNRYIFSFGYRHD
jgi:hypothetical protein